MIKSNNLTGCTYIEPYTGGGAVALKLLIDGIVNNIVINDFDKSIYAFWFSVLNYTNELCDLIENTSITIDNWYKQREIQQNKDTEDLLRLGFSTLFLNRTNRSGIIKAGVIGGLNQSGNYKLDCRFKKEDIISKIRKISEYRDHITLYNYDTLYLIENIIPTITDPMFIFFDPPYYHKGSSLYVNYYTHGDHVQLSNAISNLENTHWIVTYDNIDEIIEMYQQFRKTSYGIRYTAGKKYNGKEIMIYSDVINITDELNEII